MCHCHLFDMREGGMWRCHSFDMHEGNMCWHQYQADMEKTRREAEETAHIRLEQAKREAPALTLSLT